MICLLFDKLLIQDSFFYGKYDFLVEINKKY